jgi:hypothetical protein
METLELTRGDTLTFSVGPMTRACAAATISGARVIFAVRETYATAPVIEIASDDAPTPTDSVTLTSTTITVRADSASLVPRRYYWDLRVVETDSTVSTVQSGWLLVGQFVAPLA